MKNILITLFFFLWSSISFGQTKADFISCLDIIFGQSEFQPAFSNHESAKGNLIIVSPGTRIRKATNKRISDFRNSLIQDDFRFSEHYIKVLRPGDLEILDIHQTAPLEIFLSGNEAELTIGLVSIIWEESQRYFWGYSLVKVGEIWELKSKHLDKERIRLADW